MGKRKGRVAHKPQPHEEALTSKPSTNQHEPVDDSPEDPDDHDDVEYDSDLEPMPKLPRAAHRQRHQRRQRGIDSLPWKRLNLSADDQFVLDGVEGADDASTYEPLKQVLESGYMGLEVVDGAHFKVFSSLEDLNGDDADVADADVVDDAAPQRKADKKRKRASEKQAATTAADGDAEEEDTQVPAPKRAKKAAQQASDVKHVEQPLVKLTKKQKQKAKAKAKAEAAAAAAIEAEEDADITAEPEEDNDNDDDNDNDADADADADAEEENHDHDEDVDDDDDDTTHDAAEELSPDFDPEALQVSGVEEWEVLESKLDKRILKALAHLNFVHPTKVQQATLPLALRPRSDLLIAAETGSGKTLAFGIPIVHMILELFLAARRREEKHAIKASLHGDLDEPAATEEAEDAATAPPIKSSNQVITSGLGAGPLALIMAPTRELAMQVCQSLRDIAQFSPVKVAPIVGGISIEKQERFLRRQPHIIVATPGRLWEHYERGNEWVRAMSNIRFLVLDEADRMVADGHFRELKMILGLLPKYKGAPVKKNKQKFKKPLPDSGEEYRDYCAKPRQTFVCSATLSMAPRLSKSRLQRGEKARSAFDILMSRIDFHKPKQEVIDISNAKITASNLQEAKITCLKEEKDIYLYYFLHRYPGRTIVFTNSIDCLRRLSSLLTLLEFPAYPLHAKMQQRARLKNLERFRSKTHSVLIASDVAARGLDIPAVDHVVHYQLPFDSESYVHRSGRTARASAEGLTLLLVGPEDRGSFSRLLRSLNKEADDFPEYPIEASYLKGVRLRVNAARRVDKLEHAFEKKQAKKSWFIKAAQEAEIDLDDDILSDEDEGAARRREKQHQAQVASLKAELRSLMKQPLLPTGVSKSYVTRHDLPNLIATTQQEGTQATKSIKAKRFKRR